MYVDYSIKKYLNLIKSGRPTPGGGSASSLVSNLGAALTLMTSNFSLDKEYFKELDSSIQEKVKQTHKDIEKSIIKFDEFMDEDARGFASVIKTYNKDDFDNEEEKEKELEKNYKKALTAPLNCSKECLKLLKLQNIIVEYGNNETITDVGIGVILAYAALEGCIMSVRINLKYVEDENYTKKTQDEINSISEEASSINNRLREKIDSILKI